VLSRLPYDWNDGEIKIMYDGCQCAMKFISEDTPVLDERYRRCLQRGRESIIEKMIELIINKTYFKPQCGSGQYRLNSKDAPYFITKFLQQIETVFTGDKEIKIRRKTLAPTVGVANSAAADVSLPTPTDYWSRHLIKGLYAECQRAMKIVENNPAIISGEYKQCLQRGSDIIIKHMMDFIMNPEYFPLDSASSQYLFYWKRSPEALGVFLQHIGSVFTRDKELQIRVKRIVKMRNKTMTIPSKASLVALVETPEPRQKCGILRRYGEMKSFSADDKLQLEVLQGKRILNEKWAEEGETYELSGEAKAMLCMHLWSLMKYVGFLKSEKIWEGISKGWPECVSWGEGLQGTFWKIIYSDEVPLRIQAGKHGLESILDAYEDMQRYFKEDSKHSLIPFSLVSVLCKVRG